MRVIIAALLVLIAGPAHAVDIEKGCGAGLLSQRGRRGETALCKDLSHSMSQHRRGTCSGHGGVLKWEADLPP